MSLSILPTELIAHVFRSVDSLGSAAALSLTSRRLQTVWRHNLPSICDAVLPRANECYDQACLLLEAGTKSPIVASGSSDEDRTRAAVSRTKMLFANARLAHLALEEFERQVVRYEGASQCGHAGKGSDRSGSFSFGPLGRIRFLTAYYRAASMSHVVKRSETELRNQVLASMRLLDLFRMCEFMEWLMTTNSQWLHPREHIALPDYECCIDEGGVGGNIWEDLLEFCFSLEDDLSKISTVRLTVTTNDPQKWCFFSKYMLHEDGPSAKTDRMENMALADLLPLLPR